MQSFYTNHTTHSSTASCNLCTASSIHLFLISPPTSHQTKLLYVTLNNLCKLLAEWDKYIRNKNNKRINQTVVADLVTNIYNRAASIEKVVNGFRITGKFPINRHYFIAEEFVTILNNNDKYHQTPPTPELNRITDKELKTHNFLDIKHFSLQRDPV